MKTTLTSLHLRELIVSVTSFIIRVQQSRQHPVTTYTHRDWHGCNEQPTNQPTNQFLKWPNWRLPAMSVDSVRIWLPKSWLFFIHLSVSPPWTHLHQIWYWDRGRGHNYPRKIFLVTVKSRQFCGVAWPEQWESDSDLLSDTAKIALWLVPIHTAW